MKKFWPVLLALLMLAAFFVWQKKPSGPEAAPVASSDKGMSYSLKITVRQQSGSEAETILIAADGTFDQFLQSAREYMSQWTAINSLTIMNKGADPDISQSLVKKLIVSSWEGKEGYAHYFGRDFPEDMIPFQVSVLQRMLVPFSAHDRLMASPVQQNESDEIGIANVRYDLQENQDGFSVKKTWNRYDQEGIKVDEHDRSVEYALDKNERLIRAKGKIVLHYRQATPARYTIEIAIEKIGEDHRAVGLLPPAKSSMKKIGRPELVQAVARAENRTVFTYEEAMKKLQDVKEDTASNDVYAIFSSLKDEINKDPSHASEIIQKILATKERDPASRRRLSVLFGALSQTSDANIANQLAQMVDQCPDTYCKVQAASAVNTHPNPTEAAAEQMLRIADSDSDPDVASTAFLAAGAVGRRLEGQLDNMPKHLLNDLNDPKKSALKPAIIAAMGNHGSNQYTTALQEYALSKDANLRASAIYSMRYLSQDGVDEALVKAAGDSDNQVVQEAYKAIEYRDLTAESYEALAKKAAGYSDLNLQQLAARIFLQAYREDPAKVETAFQDFQSSTKVPEVKEFLEGEKQKIIEERKAAESQDPG